jgi:hypothetical protein
MKLREAGGAHQQIELAADWHQRLSDHQLAAYIRYQYIWRHENEWDWDTPSHLRTRRTWDGGKDSFGVKHSCVWTRISRAVREANADPGIWVAAHFSDISRNQLIAQTHTIPEVRPSALAASNSLATYHKYFSVWPDSLRQAFQVAGSTVANRIRGTLALKMSPDDQSFYVLCDEAYVSASPFFRYVFAEHLGCQRGIERYLWRAALEYDAQQRLYDAALSDEPQCFTENLYAALYDIRKHWREFA